MMADNILLNNLSAEETDLSSRVFNLVIGRVFKKTYLNLDKNVRENMVKTFLSDDDKEKEKFIKKFIPNFKKVFIEEAKNIEEEIKAEIAGKI